MTPSRQVSRSNCDYDTRNRKRSRYLSSTIERLARAGEQARFRVEEMIEMLNAGLSIGALLDMISYSLSNEALEFTQQRQGESTSASAPLRMALEGHPWDA
jgi:hypothetical protein